MIHHSPQPITLSDWEGKRTLAKGDFAGKCLLGTLTLPVKIATLGLVPFPLSMTPYWNYHTVKKIMYNLRHDPLAKVFAVTQLQPQCKKGNPIPFYPREYSIRELKRYGLINEDQKFTIIGYFAAYQKCRKDLAQASKRFFGRKRTYNIKQYPSYRQASRAMQQLKHEWRKYQRTLRRTIAPEFN